MPMSTSDVPFLRQEPMPDPTSPVERKAAGRAGAVPPKGSDDPDRPLVGESSDPEVHKLLADRQNATLNGDTDMIRGIDARLAELGYRREEGTGDD